MEKLNLKLNKRPWGTIHYFEEKERKSHLRNLTIQQSFRIYCDLYQIAIQSCSQHDLSKFQKEKIKTLSKIHTIFNRVKE